MNFTASYRVSVLSSFAMHFHPDHLADLRGSGLNDDTICGAGVYSLSPRDIQLFFSPRKGVPSEIQTALCFPYQGGDFARIKLFPSLGKMKYSQPPKTSARLYVPFPAKDDLLYVCEGEKKTLAAHQAGVNAVGIGGVWSWLSQGTPIDDIAVVNWDGRDVVVIPDSDVFRPTRSDLLRAIYALGRELRDRGASVSVAQIPETGTEKAGLDDYLLTGGDISEIPTFVLGSRIFQRAQGWYGRWKVKTELEAA